MNLLIRRAILADVDPCFELWAQSVMLLQQMDARVKLLPDARSEWVQRFTVSLQEPETLVVVAEQSGQFGGYMLGKITHPPPGLAPEKIGIITDLVVESHHEQRGVGRALFSHARDWFLARHVDHVLIQVATRRVVEQAFWRAQGATDWMNLLWLNL